MIKKRQSQTSKMFDLLLANPPKQPDGTRRTGAAPYSAFWKGYDGIKPCYLVRGTFAYAAWRAGKAHKKQEASK